MKYSYADLRITEHAEFQRVQQAKQELHELARAKWRDQIQAPPMTLRGVNATPRA